MRLHCLFPLLLAGALASCVATGRKVDEGQLHQFQKGRTHYVDVVAALGKPTSMTLRDDGTRQAIYAYTQSQIKPESFIPFYAWFAQGVTSETTTVVLEFDARSVLVSYAATAGDMAVGTGWSSGQKQ